MTNSIYYLLGHIDNYSGGFSSNDGIFKRISFLDFDWKIDNEKINKSERLIEMCQNILNENKLQDDIHIEKWEGNKGLTIFSKNVISLINNFITEKSEWLGREHFEINKDVFDKFERWDENSNSYKQRLNFLFGVIDANGIENEFYFYNGYDKCLLTQYVLRCFADEDDQITLKSYFKTPWVDILTINKEGDIWKNIIKKYCS
jgi:hypothetical protein